MPLINYEINFILALSSICVIIKYTNKTFFVIYGKMVFLFSQKYIFPLDGKWKTIFLKNTLKYDIFVYMYKYYKYDITILKEEAKIILSQKNTLKRTGKNDIHPRNYGISVKIPLDWHCRLKL